MRFTTLLLGGFALATAAPAFAQDDTAPPKAITATGSVTLLTDYRFRGLTQTDGDVAVESTININHKSGFYIGTFISNIDGSGRTPALTGYGDAEVDLYGGFTKALSNGIGTDVGLLYYYYPGGVDGQHTDFFEPYASFTYTIGPVATKLGAAYAWGGQSGLAGFDVKGGNDDNIYVFGEGSVGIPTTPVTLKAHLGYSSGSLGSVNAPGSNDNNYYDWSLTAEAVRGPFKLGVSYIDTDISNTRLPGFGRNGFASELGRGSTVLGYIGASF
ncbi:TorF family putative porin [Sphingomonas oligophenolica]|nr:TorF family putative porin [Sphingomonas oligophenolica]